MSTDTKSEIDPTKTPLFIGTGVEFAGTIRHGGPHDERAVILGSLTGEVHWNGILQVPTGGKIVVQGTLRCREMMIGGEIVGEGDDVVIETGLLRLGNSARIDVATVSLPPGGLEQARGSVINAKLQMTSDHPFAETEVATPASEPLRLVAGAAPPIASGPSIAQDRAADATEADTHDGGDSSGPDATDHPLVQVETRSEDSKSLAV